jgi:hypothetical protein
MAVGVRGLVKGIRSVSIPAVVRDRPYLFSDWDPLWAGLQDLGPPVAIHVGTGENVFKMTTRLRRMNAMGVDGVDAKIGGPDAHHCRVDLGWSAAAVSQAALCDGGRGNRLDCLCTPPRLCTRRSSRLLAHGR